MLHGPNLNLLGEREPAVYGHTTLAQLNRQLRAHVRGRAKLRIAQSNHEGVLIDRIHEARGWCDGLVFNPGAFTHYSYALRDALAAVSYPTYEVHLSDIHAREPFRRVSVVAEVCAGRVMGKGVGSYLEALDALLKQ